MGLQTDIAEAINLIPQDGFKYGKDVTDQVIAKIREVVEGAELTDEDIDKEHNIWCMRRGKENLKISWRQWIAQSQLQAILKAIKED